MILLSATKGQHMPLDMHQTRLADLAAWSGITPIPNDVLERHKIAEVAKRPGSWWYHHPVLVNCATQLGLLVALLGGAVSSASSIIGMAEGRPLVSLVSALLACACIFLGFIISSRGLLSREGMEIYGPAAWEEQSLDHVPFFVPRPIKEMANTVMRNGNDLSVIYGKLVQNHITVDPYLAIRRGDEQIVLGIWDGDHITHQATLKGDDHAA
jgi:hypothetical protein